MGRPANGKNKGADVNNFGGGGAPNTLLGTPTGKVEELCRELGERGLH
eukprot:COSAG01_NODE_30292_length_618_cov_31.314066_1_plen_48_part_00